ncbi:MAG: nucleotidyltransferase family protein [bacterium]|nr:nucleotidyltransferase family protein [bacterium]
MPRDPALSASEAPRADSSRRTQRRLESLLAAIDRTEELRRRARAVADWPSLFQHAFDQGVGGLLIEGLAALDDPAPVSALDPARQRLAIDRLWHRRVEAALHELLGAFAEADLRVVVLKGVVLSERLYPDPRVRPTTDMDLLAAPGDIMRVRRVLEGIGYRVPGDELRREYPHHVVLSRADSGAIELHTRASSGIGTELASEELMDRAVPYRTIQGDTVRILSPEDELIYLAVHAARHRFLRLVWLYDLRLFLKCHPELDWAAVWARARSLGTFHAVYVTCEVLRLRLRVLPGWGQDAPPRSLRGRLAARFFAREPDPSSFSFRVKGIGRELYVALLSDRIRIGMRHWTGFLLQRLLARLRPAGR